MQLQHSPKYINYVQKLWIICGIDSWLFLLVYAFVCLHARASPNLKAKHHGKSFGGEIWIVLGRIMSDGPPGFFFFFCINTHRHHFTKDHRSLPNSPLPTLCPAISICHSLRIAVDFKASCLVYVCWHISSRKISVHVRREGRKRMGEGIQQ